MNGIALRGNSQLFGSNKDNWADIASLELIAIDYFNDGLGNHFRAIGHIHLKDLGAIKKALYVLWEAKNSGTLRRFIGADTLKNTHSIMEAMG
jgi:hypothetical protein